MENGALKSNKKGLWVKILIPLFIVVIIAGIWVFKNKQSPKPLPQATEQNLDFALHVYDELDLDKLKSYGVPIIIDFGADSCIPCKQMAPILVELNIELRGKAIIKFVDVWKYQNLAQGYPISVIPTQVFFDAQGKPYIPKSMDAVQLKMYSDKDTNEHIFTTHEGGITKAQLMAILKEMGLK